MTSFRNEEIARRAIPAVTYSQGARSGVSGQSRLPWPKPAKAGQSRRRCKPALSWPKKEPASAGFGRLLPWRPKETGAGVSRRKPAPFGQRSRLSWPKGAGFWPERSRLFWPKPASGRCKPALPAKSRLLPGQKSRLFWPGRSRLFWPKAGFFYI